MARYGRSRSCRVITIATNRKVVTSNLHMPTIQNKQKQHNYGNTATWKINAIMQRYKNVRRRRFNNSIRQCIPSITSTITETSSSAVANRARDALCPSVVSLNKIITRAESFIIVTWASDLPLRSVVFGVTLRLLVIHFVVVSVINKLGRLLATNVIHDPSQVSVLYLPLERFTLPIEARYWLRIAISAYATCIWRPR